MRSNSNPGPRDRRQFIGGSDARIIMSADEAALIRLWKQKRGEAEPEDLSDNLVVQLGVATEALNRSWYERNTGRAVGEVQRWVQHPVHRFLAATLDGFVDDLDAVFEAKFMLPWSFSEEAAAEKHMAQLQHNMWVTNAKLGALSIITGGGKWVELAVPADSLYQHFLVTAERRFWRCVQTGETPRPYGIEPPRARIEAVRIVDMSESNSWAEFAGLFCATRSAFLDHERAKVELKALMPEDAKEASGHGVRAQTLEVGRDQLRSAAEGGKPCSDLAKPSARSPPPSPRLRRSSTNPEKALIATIRASNPRDQDQTFRYAALSSGLDIVRKALGGHEIATVQTTAIDNEAGLIRLTTTLAHSSGEWLSSEWPVCPISETASPRRMGAALTYARRYALFTLVGIAGEDDLDAPDLNGKVAAATITPAVGAKIDFFAETQPATAPNEGPSEPLAASPTSATTGFARKEKAARPARPVLGPEQSAAARERLLADMGELQSAEEAADWVHKNLPLKNTLSAADADFVEVGFRERLATIESASTAGEGQSQSAPQQVPARSGEEPFLASTGDATAAPMVLYRAATVRRRPVSAKTIRLRDKLHCKFVATHPCIVCGRTPTEAHHIRFAQPRALGRKVSDEYTVPVCRLHHRELHRYGDEASWWAGVSIDPLPIALDLWRRSRLRYSPQAVLSEPLSEVIAPSMARVDRLSLDDDARDRIE